MLKEKHEQKIVLNVELSFLAQLLSKCVKIECSVTLVVNFFAHDAVFTAKKLLYFKLNMQGQVISDAKYNKNIVDMCKLLVSAATEKKNIPCFGIFSPCETSVISGTVSATLASKVNKVS